MIRVARLFERIFIQLAIVNGILTFLIILLICADITGRKLFNSPLQGSNELATLFLVALIFLGMAAAQIRGAHYNVDLLYGAVPKLVQKVFDVISSVISMVFAGFLAKLTIQSAWKSTMMGESSYAIIAFPIWPARIVIAVGLTCLTIQFFFTLLRHLSLLPGPADHRNDEGGAL